MIGPFANVACVGGFPHGWSRETLRWDELINIADMIITCKPKEPSQPIFRYQASVVFDHKDRTARKYPRFNLVIRPPLELENLLPFGVNYRVHDKNSKHDGHSYFLREGGVVPIHSVQLDNLILLSLDVRESGTWALGLLLIMVSCTRDYRLRTQ
jgi:vacuolar protein sorting-associated protein 13A/C